MQNESAHKLKRSILSLKNYLDHMDESVISDKLLSYKALSLLAVAVGLQAIEKAEETGIELDNADIQVKRILSVKQCLETLYDIELERRNKETGK